MKKLFIYGDSISIQYQPYLEQELLGRYTIERKGLLSVGLNDLGDMSVNGGDSGQLIEYLKRRKIEADIFLFNTGLHDSRILSDGGHQIELNEYSKNLLIAVHILLDYKVFPIFMTSTYINEAFDQSALAFKRSNEIIDCYNKTAARLMHALWIPVIDLGTVSKLYKTEDYIDSVHFSNKANEKSAYIIKNYLLKMEKELNQCALA